MSRATIHCAGATPGDPTRGLHSKPAPPVGVGGEDASSAFSFRASFARSLELLLSLSLSLLLWLLPLPVSRRATDFPLAAAPATVVQLSAAAVVSATLGGRRVGPCQ
eukprot:GHVU01121339.1.p3 GENE.GHVU01121339.1~~GHVU01121339.1.p3  ORF type:complete len:107 (+),score=13.67 GHVU01121339.1:442-762(+)